MDKQRRAIFILATLAVVIALVWLLGPDDEIVQEANRETQVESSADNQYQPNNKTPPTKIDNDGEVESPPSEIDSTSKSEEVVQAATPPRPLETIEKVLRNLEREIVKSMKKKKRQPSRFTLANYRERQDSPSTQEAYKRLDDALKELEQDARTAQFLNALAHAHLETFTDDLAILRIAKWFEARSEHAKSLCREQLLRLGLKKESREWQELQGQGLPRSGRRVLEAFDLVGLLRVSLAQGAEGIATSYYHHDYLKGHTEGLISVLAQEARPAALPALLKLYEDNLFNQEISVWEVSNEFQTSLVAAILRSGGEVPSYIEVVKKRYKNWRGKNVYEAERVFSHLGTYGEVLSLAELGEQIEALARVLPTVILNGYSGNFGNNAVNAFFHRVSTGEGANRLSFGLSDLRSLVTQYWRTTSPQIRVVLIGAIYIASTKIKDERVYDLVVGIFERDFPSPRSSDGTHPPDLIHWSLWATYMILHVDPAKGIKSLRKALSRKVPDEDRARHYWATSLGVCIGQSTDHRFVDLKDELRSFFSEALQHDAAIYAGINLRSYSKTIASWGWREAPEIFRGLAKKARDLGEKRSAIGYTKLADSIDAEFAKD